MLGGSDRGSSHLRIRRGGVAPHSTSETLPLVNDTVSSLRRRYRRARNQAMWAPCSRYLYYMMLLLLGVFVLVYKPFSTRRVDHYLTYIVMWKQFAARQAYLQSLGIDIETTKIRYANEINTHAALTELLVRRKKRTLNLQALGEIKSSAFQALFVPNILGYGYPRPGQFRNFTRIPFDEREMHDLIEATFDTLQHPVPKYTDTLDLFALCAVYNYGGAYVGHHNSELVNVDRDGVPRLVLEQDDTGLRVRTLLASRGHPLLKCLLTGQRNESESVLWRLINGNLFRLGPGAAVKVALGQGSPCDLQVPPSVNSNENRPRSFSMQLVKELPTERNTLVDSVEIETLSGPSFSKHAKETLQSRMRKVGAEPGWFCNRCLNWAFAGSFASCRLWCPRGYETIICDAKPSLQQPPIDVDVIITRSLHSHSSRKKIPRIIHQTWFDTITLDRYPQLARLQMTWKMSGWDYRFYTNDAARQYIVQNYPESFLEAFDSLIHGAYKADLFRYLVLFKEGGIYADVDVKLEATSLDDFVTNSLSFFAARDIPCEYADEAYCLWNGFLGSSPGNPILLQTIERLVNLIQDRADIYDMEREICLKNNSTLPIWKARAQPLLLLSGPCGLGVAFNEALGRPSLKALELGFIGMDDLTRDHGDALILLGDKYDLGEFRISDPERNLIVASTDIRYLETTPRNAGGAPAPKAGPHYSNSKRGVTVWGSANVYTDDLVTEQRLQFNVQYKSV